MGVSGQCHTPTVLTPGKKSRSEQPEIYKLPDIHQIQPDVMQTRSKILRSDIHIPINYIWQRKELFSGEQYLCFIDIREVTTQIITILIYTYYFIRWAQHFSP